VRVCSPQMEGMQALTRQTPARSKLIVPDVKKSEAVSAI
jgi:hypothetical protein